MSRDLYDHEISDALLWKLYELWDHGQGENFNDLERDHLNDPKSHGKRLPRLWLERFGVKTSGRSKMTIVLQTIRKVLSDEEKRHNPKTTDQLFAFVCNALEGVDKTEAKERRLILEAKAKREGQ